MLDGLGLFPGGFGRFFPHLSIGDSAGTVLFVEPYPSKADRCRNHLEGHVPHAMIKSNHMCDLSL